MEMTDKIDIINSIEREYPTAFAPAHENITVRFIMLASLWSMLLSYLGG
jgi:hypothetical protein